MKTTTISSTQEPRQRFRLLPDDPVIGWTPYGWLIWLVPFLFDVFGASDHSNAIRIAAVASVILFLGLYFRGFWLSGRPLMRVTIAIFAMGALWAPIAPMAFTFYIYAAAFVGSWIRPPRAYVVLLAMTAWAIAEGWFLGQHPGTWIPPAIFIGLIGGINVHYCELTRRNSRLKLAQEEIEQLAKAAERERIGRDLHDLLGQSLSVVSLKSQLARRLLDTEPGRARTELEEIERTARDALREVRRAVAGYRHVQIATELVKARVTLDAAGVELDVRTTPFDLSPESESVLALALRESTTNVARHSRATHCRIRTRVEASEFHLEVEDDGIGVRDQPAGTGLHGMQERLQAMGGNLEITSARFTSAGTLLRATLPLVGAKEADDALSHAAGA